MPDLVEDVPGRVLAVYAHPDDPEVSCGGTLARWAAEGGEVHVLVCTRGEKGSPEPSTKPAALARRRVKEMAASAEVLGLTGHEQLDIGDGELENTSDVRGAIVAALRRVRPDVVVCPDPTAVFFGDSYFNHHDHRTVGWATLDAVSPMAANPHYFPAAGEGHEVGEVLLSGTLEPDVWVDVGPVLATKVEAICCHRSQLPDDDQWLREAIRQRAEDAGREAGVAAAESFRRLRVRP